jgi:hypothetical protein
MARTQFVDIPDELRNLAQSAHERRDRFILGVVQGHKRLPPRLQKKLIREKSLFGYLATFWRALTPEQKNVWREAAQYSGITNWQLFISDNAARIRHDLPLSEPPSDLWQVRAGHIILQGEADEILLKQEHPLDYWVTEKVPGQSWKQQLVLLKEIFSFPLTLQIRYKSDLIPTTSSLSYDPPLGDAADFSLSTYTPPNENIDFSFSSGGARARYMARIWTSYQGKDTYTDYSINFAPSADWTLETLTIQRPRGIVVGYTLFLDVLGYQGELLFDNIRATHGGTNWARDPRCDDISKEFKGVFAVVPPFWIPVTLPAGASFASVYPPAL